MEPMSTCLLMYVLHNNSHKSSSYCNTYCTQDAMECSVLMGACIGGFVDIARMLLEHGAVVDYQDKVKYFMND